MSDMVGEKFYNLTVIGPFKKKRNHLYWNCKCICGQTVYMRQDKLKSGKRKSCGCLNNFRGLKKGYNGILTKGYNRRKSYRSWYHMIARCENSNEHNYPNYGGRGITVCDEWHNYEKFLIDMGEPLPGYSIDRINNNDGYYKKNCRWATQKEQSRNKRTNVFIELNGEIKCIADWAEIKKISPRTIRYRHLKGLTAEECFRK